MAQKFRAVDPRTWTDEKFRGLAPDSQRLALYVLTSRQANRTGLFVFSPAMAAEELGMSAETFGERFANVVETFGWTFDEEARVLFLPTWWKYNRPANPNVMKACLGDLHDLPATPLLKTFCENTRYLPQNLAKILANVAANVLPNVPRNVSPQDQDQDQDQENLPPSPPNEAAGVNGSDWEGVVEMLAERGVGRAREAVTSARNRGATRDAVLAIVAEFDQQPRRYGPGALKDRVAGDLAHWPPPNAEAVRVDEAAAQEARLRREREETQRRRQQQKADAEERESLERDYGPRLREMPSDEIRALAIEQFGEAAAATILKRHRRDAWARADLLRAVRDRSPPAPALAG